MRRHFRRVYGFFHSKLELDADDLTQRTFEVALETSDRLERSASIVAYLLGIARKQLLFHLRTKLRRDQRIALSDIAAVDFAPSPSTIVALREEQALLLTALRRIPIEMQIVIELHYFEGLRGDEVATVLEVPEGTVRSRLRRARERLKSILETLDAPAAVRRSTVQDFERWAGEIREHRKAAADESDTS